MRARARAASLLIGFAAAWWTPGAARAAVFWGDVHAHSGLSNDGTNSPESFFTLARDVVGLDFVVLSDHDIFLTADEWATLKATAAAFHEPGRFVAFSGTEWTRSWHMNVYFLADDETICGGGGGPSCFSGRSFYDFYASRVLAGEAAGHVNHPADPPFPVRWHDVDDTITTNVEIWNTAGAGDNEAGVGNAVWALQVGFRLGFVGVSDDHHTDQVPRLLGTGLTGCHAGALTRGELLAALRERRCYATNGERIVVDHFEVDGTFMGGERAAPLGSPVTASIAVTGTDTPTAIEILRNGLVVASKTDCASSVCAFSAPVEVIEPHTFIYARVHQPGDKRAWTTPVWVRGECAAATDCPIDRLAPGGGDPDHDCLAEWQVVPGPDPAAGGRVSDRVTCVDGDPTCDFGADANECTFRVGICLGVSDRRLPACAPAAVDAYQMLRPRRENDRRGRADFENRRTLLAAVRALGAAPAPGTCTPLLDLRVPLRLSDDGRPLPAARRFLGRAVSGAMEDRDRLRLVCRPAGG